MGGIWPSHNPPPPPSDGLIYLAIFLGFALGVIAAAVIWTVWRVFA